MDNKYVVLEEKAIEKVEIVLIGEKGEPIARAFIENEQFLPFVVSEVTRVTGKKVAVNDGMPRTFDDLLAAETLMMEQEVIIEECKTKIEELERELRYSRAQSPVRPDPSQTDISAARIAELEEICEERAREIKRLKNPTLTPMTVVKATSGTLEELDEGAPDEPKDGDSDAPPAPSNP